MSVQLSIDFGEWELPASTDNSRPLTPASSDLRSIAMRSLVEDTSMRTPISYISFGSGSSGNSCYVGTPAGGVIVDAGVSPDIVVDTLKSNGVSMEKVKGICLTHDHSDHVRYVYKLLRAHKHLRVYCTNRVLNAILRRHNISKRIKDYHIPVFKEFPFTLGGFDITAFDVPHDAADNAGFCFRYGGKCFVIATDMGEISERARFYMTQANFLVIEANYDLDMLIHGPYPEYLKARIRTSRGHMDNSDTARFLSEIASTGLRYVFLCHLSKDNNTPEKALDVVRAALLSKGLTVGDCSESIAARSCDMQLMALPRFTPTRWMHLR